MCKKLSDTARPAIDFAGVRFMSDTQLIWGPASSKVYTREYSYLARFPIVVVSKRLCAYLFSQRQIEAARGTSADDIMHCEVFAPSAAMAGGFACLSIDELMPGAFDASIMMLEVPGYGLPMGAVFQGPISVQMYHPVYTMEDWLEAMRQRFSTASIAREDRLRNALAGLSREKTRARQTGDELMVSAIENLRALLEPTWREFFDRQSDLEPVDQ
jgi:hypothetical protein